MHMKSYTSANLPIEILLHPELTPAEKIIFIFLNHPEGKWCRLSNDKIANLADVSAMKVSQAIKKYRELGLIEVYYWNGDDWVSMDVKTVRSPQRAILVTLAEVG